MKISKRVKGREPIGRAMVSVKSRATCLLLGPEAWGVDHMVATSVMKKKSRRKNTGSWKRLAAYAGGPSTEPHRNTKRPYDRAEDVKERDGFGSEEKPNRICG